jgi:transcriptional regulator with XRE-family HTH domain
MVRLALTEQERERGVALGAALRRARGERPVREVAALAGLAEETVRKIERGAVPTPALFTVAAIADVLGLALDELVREAGEASRVAAVA